MKKNFMYAMMSAIALTGAMTFSACQSSDEIVDNPNYNPETNTVKTQFTISLPQGINKTRQTATEVQEGTAFRGIDEIKLIPYSLESGNVLSTSSANANLISLAAISAFDHSESNSKVYADVEFENGTSNFLFYGKAADGTAGTTITSAADKFKYGSLTVAGLSGNPTLSSVEFTPKAIYGDGTTDEITAINAGKTVGTALIAALNAVADATPTSALSDETSPKFEAVTSTQNGTVKDLFDLFKSLTTASSHSVEAIFFKLYKELDGLAASDNTSDGYKLATAIRTAIDAYGTATVENGNTTAFALNNDLKGYPASVNLPDGAVRVSYTSDAFVAATSMTYASTLNVAALENYVYPANLQYYVNSPIVVSNSVQSPQYGTSDWETITTSLYTDGTKITGNTRSVAITNPIQYGVGRLDAGIAALSGTYYDSKGEEVNVTNGFTLTGILIGGQKSVGWDFAVKGTTPYTIYDKTLDDSDGKIWTVTPSVATSTNYTLALQTEAGDDNGTVRVALELVNKGPEFAGAGGQIIPANGTFYLVGELKPSIGTGYNSGTIGKDRVFTQDFKTIVTFEINNGSNDSTNENYGKGLGTATNGLPDLRSSKMEIGLSVNLSWQSGLEFTVGM